MASYTRLGSFLLADALATPPWGRIHRAIAITGSAFERHLLLCAYSDELLAAGLAARGQEIQRVAAQLGAVRHVEGTLPALGERRAGGGNDDGFGHGELLES